MGLKYCTVITTQDYPRYLGLDYPSNSNLSLFENHKFSFNKTDEEIKNLMERDSDPLACFVQDCLVMEENQITKEEMFEIYSKYCGIKKLPRLSKEQLGRRLPNYAQFIIAKRDKKNRYWDNVQVQHINNDTFDTFINNLRVMRKCKNNISQYIYKNLKKASKVSNIFSEKDIKDSGLDPKLIKKTIAEIEKENEMSK